MKSYKGLIWLFACLATTFSLHAQQQAQQITTDQETTKIKEQEFGLNISQLAIQFLPGDNQVVFFQPYLFTYKSRQKNDLFFRSGYGFNYEGNSEKPSTGAPRSNSYNLSVHVRLGFEKQYLVSPRWLLTYGLDFPFDFNYLDTEALSQFQDVRLKSSQLSGGLGPVIGFHYKLSDKVKIGTESTLYLQAYTRSSSTTVDGAEIEQNERQGLRTNLNGPVSIYFSMTI